MSRRRSAGMLDLWIGFMVDVVVTNLRNSLSLASCQAAPCSPARADAKVSGLPSSFKLRMFASADMAMAGAGSDRQRGVLSRRRV
jgi:hypothetical protein